MNLLVRHVYEGICDPAEFSFGGLVGHVWVSLWSGSPQHTEILRTSNFPGVTGPEASPRIRYHVAPGTVEEAPMPQQWEVYLSGEIHTDWRDRIAAGVAEAGLPVELTGPVTDHASSDDCGVVILGDESSDFWKDQKGARMNAIRTRTLIERADVVVVRFGDKYRQWNAAFDAGYAAACGTPVITLHDPSLNHALKEVDGAALAVAETPQQVVDTLAYVIGGRLGREGKA